MSKSMFVLAFSLVATAAVASVVVAQDREQRRQRLREGVERAAELAIDAAASEAAHGAEELLHGGVLNLGPKAGNRPLEINKGGLVIVKVEDTGSQPHKDLKVEAGQSFQRLGQVRPTRAKPGAGSEWVLLKAVTEGDASITVTYTPNAGGEAVNKSYKLTITAGEAAVAN